MRDTAKVRKLLALPASAADAVDTLSFSVERAGAGQIAATVEIDDIRFLTAEQAREATPWPNTDPWSFDEARLRLAPPSTAA